MTLIEINAKKYVTDTVVQITTSDMPSTIVTGDIHQDLVTLPQVDLETLE